MISFEQMGWGSGGREKWEPSPGDWLGGRMGGLREMLSLGAWSPDMEGSRRCLEERAMLDYGCNFPMQAA